MSVFADYARYYDLLYKDKPYGEEVAYITRVLKRHAPEAKRLMELGCGTGIHAALLAKEGYEVFGVDMSEWMLERAGERLKTLPADEAKRLHFSEGDVRNVRIGETVDVALSLFHVMSYQTSNQDVADTFATASAHLQAGGLFFFDVWYGPAVLAERPATRVKRLEDDALAITRMAEPVLHPVRCVVDVNYHIIARDKASGAYSENTETHPMRYFFTPELTYFAQQNGFDVIDSHVWLEEDRAPGEDSWGVSFLCRKQ